MQNYHSIPRYIKIKQTGDRKSILLLAKRPSEKLIVFVHGFGGSPLKTWSNFHNYICGEREFMDCDILFYNYDSKQIQAPNSGDAFCNFMDQLYINNGFFNSHFPEDSIFFRKSTFRYRKIFLVAHSLGAIICRWALNRSHFSNSSWHKLTTMLLFAPAHMGAIAVEPISLLFQPFPLNFLGGFFLFRTPTINDVDINKPNCSLFKLIDDTEKLQNAGAGNFTICAYVVWAEKEWVVKNEDFLADSHGKLEYGTKHTTICNPNYEYLEPLTHLISLVQ